MSHALQLVKILKPCNISSGNKYTKRIYNFGLTQNNKSTTKSYGTKMIIVLFI